VNRIAHGIAGARIEARELLNTDIPLPRPFSTETSLLCLPA
jgi:hypothetical protein